MVYARIVIIMTLAQLIAALLKLMCLNFIAK